MLGQLAKRTCWSCFSRIKVEEVLPKSYQELVELVATRYGNREFKHPNAAALYEIQHQFQVISPGDAVLDIGAGPQFRWTDLALSLAEDPAMSHRVISNDVQVNGIVRPNCLYVRGNFLEQQVRTKIALALGENQQFDTILIDASPEFTRSLQKDAERLGQVTQEAFYFSNLFLKKGGNMVCKLLHSSTAKLIEETGRLCFHQAYSFRPSVLRPLSPVYFMIFKGFGMNPDLEAMKQFISRYRGSPKNKTAVVRHYQNKYSWDPVKVIKQKVKDDYWKLRSQGRSVRDIQNMFQDDPFINVNSIIKQAVKVEQAQEKQDDLAFKKAVNQYTDGKLYSEYAEIPNSREEWINFLQKIEKKMKDEKKPKKKEQNLEPLGENEVYMREGMKQEEPEEEYLYIEEDLTGEYDIKYEQEFIQRELAKLEKATGKSVSLSGENNEKHINLEKLFEEATEGDRLNEEVEQLADSFRGMTDQDFKQLLEDEEGYYHQEREHNVGKSVKGATNKFKNK